MSNEAEDELPLTSHCIADTNETKVIAMQPAFTGTDDTNLYQSKAPSSLPRTKSRVRRLSIASAFVLIFLRQSSHGIDDSQHLSRKKYI
jgi:hypothetical protein